MLIRQTYGVIIVFRELNNNLFLILQNNNAEGSWSFPKGHVEGNELPKETALRELREETEIIDVEFLDVPLIHEEYERNKKNGSIFLKRNDYFIGFVKNKNIKIQKEEVYTYKWATYQEAFDTFEYKSRKEVLKIARKHLEMC